MGSSKRHTEEPIRAPSMRPIKCTMMKPEKPLTWRLLRIDADTDDMYDILLRCGFFSVANHPVSLHHVHVPDTILEAVRIPITKYEKSAAANDFPHTSVLPTTTGRLTQRAAWRATDKERLEKQLVACTARAAQRSTRAIVDRPLFQMLSLQTLRLSDQVWSLFVSACQLFTSHFGPKCFWKDAVIQAWWRSPDPTET